MAQTRPMSRLLPLRKIDKNDNNDKNDMNERQEMAFLTEIFQKPIQQQELLSFVITIIFAMFHDHAR